MTQQVTKQYDEQANERKTMSHNLVPSENMNKDWTYYISGPMSGKPQFNYPLFKEVATSLRNLGFAVTSPTEVDKDVVPEEYNDVKPYKWYLFQAIALMNQCDAIVLLPGWYESRGARIEYEIARACDMPVFFMWTNPVDDADTFYAIGLSE